jgi:hypothetical protein
MTEKLNDLSGVVKANVSVCRNKKTARDFLIGDFDQNMVQARRIYHNIIVN